MRILEIYRIRIELKRTKSARMEENMKGESIEGIRRTSPYLKICIMSLVLILYQQSRQSQYKILRYLM